LTAGDPVKYYVIFWNGETLSAANPDIYHSMLLIKEIARKNPGELASACVEALKSCSRPLAAKAIVSIHGLDPEMCESGDKDFIDSVNRMIRDYGLDDFAAKKRFPDFLSVTTDSDRILCASIIKHLGNPVGLLAGITDFDSKSSIPLEEGLYLTASQLGVRIHTILSPGSRHSVEITGRRLLGELRENGVTGITVGSIEHKGNWATIISAADGFRMIKTADTAFTGLETVKSGDLIEKEMLNGIWPDCGIEEGLMLTDLPGYIIIVGFSDKKSVTRQTKTAVKSAVDKLAGADIEYIINSFEKLKADFKKLVKSERATAITETAVTVNHEINNPLTAILGNAQLLLMGEKDLPKEVAAKLKTIEKSAIQIRETTSKLMAIVEPVRTPYASGLNMIDINKSKKKED